MKLKTEIISHTMKKYQAVEGATANHEIFRSIIDGLRQGLDQQSKRLNESEKPVREEYAESLIQHYLKSVRVSEQNNDNDEREVFESSLLIFNHVYCRMLVFEGRVLRYSTRFASKRKRGL